MPVFMANALEDWLRPEGLSYQALLFPRAQSWRCFQNEIDACINDFGPENQIETKITREIGKEVNFQQLDQSGSRLHISRLDLHQELLEIVVSDAARMGKTLAELCPWRTPGGWELLWPPRKLELMGEHSCPRWHRDHYCGRGIVTYNLCGTEYTPEARVVGWEAIRTFSKLPMITAPVEVGVGDMFFMKGKGFPSGEKGLIHKSPLVQFHQDGEVMNRLVLKLDIPL
eukprot:Skav215985  [mRNA]  locus=scaffold4378:70960:77458:+ [translate_table: standard]